MRDSTEKEAARSTTAEQGEDAEEESTEEDRREEGLSGERRRVRDPAEAEAAEAAEAEELHRSLRMALHTAGFIGTEEKSLAHTGIGTLRGSAARDQWNAHTEDRLWLLFM